MIVSEGEHSVDSRFLPRRVVHPFELDVGPGQTGQFEVLTTCNMADLSSGLRRTSLPPGGLTVRLGLQTAGSSNVLSLGNGHRLSRASAFPESLWRIPNKLPKSRCEMALAGKAGPQGDVSDRKICFR